MPASARRLLGRLGEPDAYATDDPTEPGAVVVRSCRGAVSVGGGRFSAGDADLLARSDLAEALPGAGGRRRYRITEAGRRHLRRQAAASDDRFLDQHRDCVVEHRDVEGQRTALRLNAAESPLDWLRRRKDRQGEPLVDETSYEAGERLRRDLTLGQMLPGVTMNWSVVTARRGAGTPGDADGATASALAARQRVTRALDAVGPDFADLLVDLCGFLKGLETIERERGWPARSAKVVVKLALRRLADHYGLSGAAHGPARVNIRAWREPAVPAPEGD